MIADQLAVGHDVLLEIDWQGARQVGALFRGRSGFSSCRPRWMKPPPNGRGAAGADVGSPVAWPLRRRKCAVSGNLTMLSEQVSRRRSIICAVVGIQPNLVATSRALLKE